MAASRADTAARLAREIEHHRRIAENAEAIWNWESPAGRVRADRRADLFVSLGKLGPGTRALELGCGTGVFLSKVARCGAAIHGLDLSMDLLSKARARLMDFDNARLDRGNAEELPYPSGCFDVVYGSSVLHHLDLEAALRETFRVLKPGGRAVFAEPNVLNPLVALMFHWEPLKPHYGVSADEMAFSRFRARRVLGSLGFQEVLVRPFDFLYPGVPLSMIPLVSRAGMLAEHVPLLREVAGSLLILARKAGGV